MIPVNKLDLIQLYWLVHSDPYAYYSPQYD